VRDSSPHRRQRGFTLIEMAVVVAIIAVVAGLAIASFSRQRPRAHLASATAELHSLIHGARQTALSTGHDVVVMVFPRFATSSGTGRVVVYEDGDFDFFTAGAAGGMDFERFDPTGRRAGGRSQVLEVFDLPAGVAFGASPGAPSSLPAPLNGIDISLDCTFCGVLSDHRGAIRFDGRGRAWFHGANGVAPTVAGAALNVTSAGTDAVQGQRTLVITPITGSVRLISNG
jgi:prepilin-type N-terminal cleavage/methylation domain-containing protein